MKCKKNIFTDVTLIMILKISILNALTLGFNSFVIHLDIKTEINMTLFCSNKVYFIMILILYFKQSSSTSYTSSYVTGDPQCCPWKNVTGMLEFYIMKDKIK